MLMTNKKKNEFKVIIWWRLWKEVYSSRRNRHISYMMHQVANALAEARRAEIRKPPKFTLCRRAERAAKW